MLKEDINFSSERIKGRNGELSTVVYINPNSESVYNFKDDIKTTFGASWNGYTKRWEWVLSNDPNERKHQLENFIYPCIKFLNKKENKGRTTRLPEEQQKKLDELISTVDKLINAKIEGKGVIGGFDEADLKKRLIEYKQQLLSIVTADDFLRLFEPMMKKVIMDEEAEYSISNKLLIYLQDEDATCVLSLKNWNKKNRYVQESIGKTIALWVPIFEEDKATCIEKFLKTIGKLNISQLTPEEKTELDYALKNRKVKTFLLAPYFYDIRFTKVKRGKQDLLKSGEKLVNTKNGNENGKLQWFDETSPVTEESENIYDAVLKTIESAGVKFEYVDNLGGARGVSCGGLIKILKNAPKNIGTDQTLIHELSHELLHQIYLKGSDKGDWGSFFVGRENGKNVVEQQAELSSWIVMRLLGYDMGTNVNYVGNWGLNAGNAEFVFDSVASAAQRIYSSIIKFMKNTTLNESIIKEGITGLMVAKLVGMEDLYVQSKEQNKNELEECATKELNKINESFNKILGINIL